MTVSERIDGERELGRDDRAWALLARAPLHTDADEDASLALHRLEMSEDRLSGAYAGAGYEDLSTLAMVGQSARAELRRGQLSMEALAGHDRLDSATGPVVGAIHADEAKAGLALSFQGGGGDTRVEAGAYAFASGTVPYATAVQRFEPLHGLTVDLEGLYHERPTDTAALRAAALKDSAEAEIAWRFAERYQIVARRRGDALRRSRRRVPGQRRRGPHGAVGAAAAGIAVDSAARRRVRRGQPAGVGDPGRPGRGRVRLVRPAAKWCPRPTARPASASPSWGPPTTKMTWPPGGGRSRAGRCLRPLVDLWAGWLMPAQTITYSVDGGMGYLFAHHQELAATGFYRNDQGGQVGQRYVGLSLHYALRWN